MAPKLYLMETSPPCRAVLMVAKAIGLDLDLEVVESDQLKTEDMLKLNPQHTVPILADADEDFTFWDSHAIAGYLVGQYSGDDVLYPKDVKKRALIDQRLHFENGILFTQLRATFIRMLTGEKIPEGGFGDLLEALGFMEKFLDGRQWFAGDELTIADLSLLASVVTLETVLFPVDPDRFPQLYDWLTRAKALPYYEECNSVGLRKLKALFSKLYERP